MNDPRKFQAFECDHLRQKVRLEDGWHHVNHDGSVGEICIAGTYRMDGMIYGEHFLDRLVLES